MPSVIDSPSGRLSEKVPRWDLTGTEGCGSGKVFSWTPLMVMEYLGIYRLKNRVRRALRQPQGKGHALHPCRRLGTLLTWLSSPRGVFWSKKNHHKVSFCLDSISYSVSVKIKN